MQTYPNCPACNKEVTAENKIYGRKACKQCVRKTQKARYAANRDKRLKYKKKYNQDNAEKRAHWQRNYNKLKPGVVKANNLKRYGITPEVFEDMLAKQNGVCKVCFGTNGRYRLAVDHCHKTGAVRGLLCSRCNVAIGMAQDCPHRLKSLANYLESV